MEKRNLFLILSLVASQLSIAGLEGMKRSGPTEDSKVFCLEDRCSVCFDDYEDETQVAVLACKHSFCKNCFDKLCGGENKNCPLCRISFGDKPYETTTIYSYNNLKPNKRTEEEEKIEKNAVEEEKIKKEEEEKIKKNVVKAVYTIATRYKKCRPKFDSIEARFLTHRVLEKIIYKNKKLDKWWCEEFQNDEDLKKFKDNKFRLPMAVEISPSHFLSESDFRDSVIREHYDSPALNTIMSKDIDDSIYQIICELDKKYLSVEDEVEKAAFKFFKDNNERFSYKKNGENLKLYFKHLAKVAGRHAHNNYYGHHYKLEYDKLKY